jgi:hypothetical protein
MGQFALKVRKGPTVIRVILEILSLAAAGGGSWDPMLVTQLQEAEHQTLRYSDNMGEFETSQNEGRNMCF